MRGAARDDRVDPARDAHMVRVSFSALLRVGDGGRYVLFHSPWRPGSYGPPGGVFKFFDPATPALRRLGFREERTGTSHRTTRSDLRGFIPRGSVRGFQRWFAGGAYREDAAECLRRELIEELGEVGFPQLAEHVHGLTFTHVATTLEGPLAVPGKPYRQLRRFEVHDLAPTTGPAARLRHRLLELGADPGVETVLCATPEEIAHGRNSRGLISSQSALLVYSRKIQPDQPALP